MRQVVELMEHAKNLLDLWTSTKLLFGQDIDVIAYQANPERSQIGSTNPENDVEIESVEVSSSQPKEWYKVCCEALPDDTGIVSFFPHTTCDKECKRLTYLISQISSQANESFTPLQNLSCRPVNVTLEYPISMH